MSLKPLSPVLNKQTALSNTFIWKGPPVPIFITIHTLTQTCDVGMECADSFGGVLQDPVKGRVEWISRNQPSPHAMPTLFSIFLQSPLLGQVTGLNPHWTSC